MGLGDLLNILKTWAEGIIHTMDYPGLYLIMRYHQKWYCPWPVA